MHGVAGVNNGAPYCPNLAALGTTGVNYVDASTSKPSDSFPGLMTIVSGATPRTLGVYYDVAYDRSLDGPMIATGNGSPAGTCTPGAAPTGYETEYEEGIDLDQTKLNGGAPGASLIDGRHCLARSEEAGSRSGEGMCAGVCPGSLCGRTRSLGWSMTRAGMRHGRTSILRTRRWRGQHGMLDDFYSPEINSNVVAVPGLTTVSGISCATVPDPSSDLTAWTNSFQNIQCYDQLKVNAILHEIDGMDHLGTTKTRTPTIFGMNFQAVSVGQKLIEGSRRAAIWMRRRHAGSLLSEIQFADEAIGRFVEELKDHGKYESTLIVITAKHGQSPIDSARYTADHSDRGAHHGAVTDHRSAVCRTPSPMPATRLGPPRTTCRCCGCARAARPKRKSRRCQATVPGDGQYRRHRADLLRGSALTQIFNAPGLPPKDPRTPDIIVVPNVGITYSKSTAKQAEHWAGLRTMTPMSCCCCPTRRSTAALSPCPWRPRRWPQPS